ncbi:hypothetical protein HW555_013825 [Spodoptera exigua]|uniref:Tyr recombinase domain-containing protein n=1 Tax=Spodoptera exigua TaxID=7107 RepID=A0A835G0X9_SPOEX|nr:hypothetical protein HW555_013825 [Spodoptera exigua]
MYLGAVDISRTDSQMRIKITDLIKTSRVGSQQPVLILPFFNQKPAICPARTLLYYLNVTGSLCGTSKGLFIGLKKPHGSVSSQTLSRWIRSTLMASGVDVAAYGAHSARHAATSAALRAGVSLDAIRRTAGWTASSETFFRFYNRPLDGNTLDDSFERAIMGVILHLRCSRDFLRNRSGCNYIETSADIKNPGAPPTPPKKMTQYARAILRQPVDDSGNLETIDETIRSFGKVVRKKDMNENFRNIHYVRERKENMLIYLIKAKLNTLIQWCSKSILVLIESPKKRTYTVKTENEIKKNKPRKYRRNYSIGSIEVCRDIGDQNKTPEEDVEFIKILINSLLKYESHYRREQNSCCQYLKVGMTIQKIYELYLEKVTEVYGATKDPVSLSKLKNTYFNLRCKGLKKDTCSRCDAFNIKIKTSTGEEQTKLIEEKMKHLKRAEDLRNNMNKDLMQAKTDENFECLTFKIAAYIQAPTTTATVMFGLKGKLLEVPKKLDREINTDAAETVQYADEQVLVNRPECTPRDYFPDGMPVSSASSQIVIQPLDEQFSTRSLDIDTVFQQNQINNEAMGITDTVEMSHQILRDQVILICKI